MHVAGVGALVHDRSQPEPGQGFLLGLRQILAPQLDTRDERVSRTSDGLFRVLDIVEPGSRRRNQHERSCQHDRNQKQQPAVSQQPDNHDTEHDHDPGCARVGSHQSESCERHPENEEAVDPAALEDDRHGRDNDEGQVNAVRIRMQEGSCEPVEVTDLPRSPGRILSAGPDDRECSRPDQCEGETPKRLSVTWISDPETRQPPLSWIQVARASTKQRRRSCRSNYAVSTKIDGSVDQSKLLSLSQGALLHREPSQ